jgi:hypothetical protein
MHMDITPLADVFVVGTLVYVLESAPATHVVNQNLCVIGSSVFDILYQVAQTVPTLDIQPASRLIRIRAHKLHVAALRVAADHSRSLSSVLRPLRGSATTSITTVRAIPLMNPLRNHNRRQPRLSRQRSNRASTKSPNWIRFTVALRKTQRRWAAQRYARHRACLFRAR